MICHMLIEVCDVEVVKLDESLELDQQFLENFNQSL